MRPTLRFTMRGPPGYRLTRQGDQDVLVPPTIRYGSDRMTRRSIRAMLLTCMMSMGTWVALAIVYFAMR
ncbi:MAG: hypothetical protein EOP89_13280 [Lysobacteraceae bacterium]|nr:MAG: hypothetical protein EOP89_13280 [Xanthomonadaceae bacterium]